MGKIRQNGWNLAKKSWERGSELPILNLKCYLVFLHLLGTFLLKFYQKKKLYLQSFWEFGSFLFFVKFNDKKGRYPRKHPHWRATVNYSAWKPSANILRTLLEFQKAIGTEVLLKVVVLPKYAWTKWVEIRIVTIPLSPNIDSPFSKFLKPEILKSDKWFCPSCNCLTESTRETSIISFGSILVIQLSQFSTSHFKSNKRPAIVWLI